MQYQWINNKGYQILGIYMTLLTEEIYIWKILNISVSFDFLTRIGIHVGTRVRPTVTRISIGWFFVTKHSIGILVLTTPCRYRINQWKRTNLDFFSVYTDKKICLNLPKIEQLARKRRHTESVPSVQDLLPGDDYMPPKGASPEKLGTKKDDPAQKSKRKKQLENMKENQQDLSKCKVLNMF